MDTQTIILIILGILVLAGLYFYSRSNDSRGQRPGTYDDPNYDSRGSIGDQRNNTSSTYDDPDYRSGGSIGGGKRTNSEPFSAQPQPRQGKQSPQHNSKDFDSGGSIGGKQNK